MFAVQIGDRRFLLSSDRDLFRVISSHKPQNGVLEVQLIAKPSVPPDASPVTSIAE